MTREYLDRTATRAEQIGTSPSVDSATVNVLGALAATLEHKERKRR